jgi:hypothetical protein
MTSPGSPRPAQARARPPRSRERSRTPAGALDPATRRVVEHAAALPRGLAVLDRAPLECVAVLVGAHPGAVARARAALGSADTRAAVLDVFARAARRDADARPEPRGAAPRLRTPEDLLRVGSERPGGLALLEAASVECAAIAFGVHPELVLAARALLGRGGLAGDDA